MNAPSFRSARFIRAVSCLLMTVAVAGSVVLSACSTSSSTPATTTERLCTPGAYVFCLCQSGDNGTKLCHDDGQQFDECLTPGSAPCPGGEAPDGGGTIDSGGGGTAEAGPPNPVNACPGKATGIDANKPITIMGNTAGGKDNGAGKAGACGVGLSSPDNIYQLIPTAKGALTVTVKGDTAFDPTVYLRSSCGDATTQLSCAETTGAGGTETFSVNVVPGRSYFLFVDGKTGSAGGYALTLSLKPGSFCGDGTVDPGEACDDGNNADSDGCSPDCKAIHGDTSPMAAGASCPGEPVHVWGGAGAVNSVIAIGTTLTYPNSWKDTDSSCNKTTNVNNAPDHVYAVTVHKTGTLTVSTQNVTFNVELLARTVCTDALTTGLSMCANNNNTASAPFDETMSFAVTTGTTYYVTVDGASVTSKGDYQLTFSLP